MLVVHITWIVLRCLRPRRFAPVASLLSLLSQRGFVSFAGCLSVLFQWVPIPGGWTDRSALCPVIPENTRTGFCVCVFR